jgi:putative membrane protein
MAEQSPKRWPGFVYDTGDEPDYRFSFANERTYLAWIRTALALLAAGVALDVTTLSFDDRLQHLAAVLLVVLALLSAGAAWVRWALAERAMRHQRPLPSFGISAPITVLLLVLGLVGLVAIGVG